jgi:long-chain acyl-CoA synthetase
MVVEPAEVRTLVEVRAAVRGDAPFLLDPEGGTPVSFAALDRRARAVAASLDAHGLSPGDRVALLLPTGTVAAAHFIAVMAAGAVVVPLSLQARDEQIAQVLDHSGCRLVFVARALRPLLDAALARLADPPAVLEAAEDGTDAAPPATWPWPAPRPTDDALLMYTSGTTGRPKGVRLTHANVLAGARFVSEAHALGPDDRVLAPLPLYHINAQIVALLAPLWHGGSVVLPDRFSARAFWGLAAAHRCTWINVVPTIIAYLLNGEDPAAGRPAPGALRFCRSASAPLAPEHHRAFERRFGIGIVETMGLTETAAPVFANPLDPAQRRIGSPGRPFGSQARIVDPESGSVLPAGTPGEIQVRGPNVMAGYHRDPEETARAFTADGWLRTGDLGYCDADGYFFVTGRLKELIIKGGENIAPREIDEILLRHPAVLEAAAVGVADPLYGQEIEAAVVLKPGHAVSGDELRVFCEAHLGRFKSPRRIHVTDMLPKGPSGKVQRLRLREREG